MSTPFSEATHPSQDCCLPKPRGLLPVPPEVAETVAREESRLASEHGFAVTAETRRRMLNQQTLDHYYRDHWISYRETPQGVEVLAVGVDEIGQLLRRLSQADQLLVQTKLV